MAARTTTGNGNVSNSDGSNLDGGTPLGSGDTLTASHNITFNANTTFGDGTDALTVTGGKTVTISSGVEVIPKGSCVPGDGNDNRILLTGTAILTIKPGSGVQCILGGGYFSGGMLCIDSTGTSSSVRATVRTDLSSGGLPTWMPYAGDYGNSYGLRAVDNIDFYDFGDSSHFGIIVRGRGSAMSVTNCTFTRCNRRLIMATDHNFTFTGNTEISPTTIINGTVNSSTFEFNLAGTSAVWTVTENGFPGGVYMAYRPPRVDFNRNTAARTYHSSGSWAAGKQDDNVFTDCEDQPLYGPMDGCYCYTPDTGNPHWFSLEVANCHITNNVFEPPAGVDGTGDVLFGGSGNVNITGNLMLAKSNLAAGTFLSLGHGETASYTVEHNTQRGLSDSGLIRTNETQPEYSGQVASCQSNICDSATSGASGGNYVIDSIPSGGAKAVNSVTKSDYNFIRNPSSGTCKYNTSTSQSNVVGYRGIEVSNANPFPNAQVGAHDQTFTGDIYRDEVRNIATWGQSLKGTDGTEAAALAYAYAHPAEATDPTTGVWAWVREGHQVTDAAFDGTAHDGGTPGAMDFVVLGPSLSISPTSQNAGTTVTITFTFGGGALATAASITADAGTLGTLTVNSDTEAEASFYMPYGVLSVTFTDATSGQTATLDLAAATAYTRSTASRAAQGQTKAITLQGNGTGTATVTITAGAADVTIDDATPELNGTTPVVVHITYNDFTDSPVTLSFASSLTDPADKEVTLTEFPENDSGARMRRLLRP